MVTADEDLEGDCLVCGGTGQMEGCGEDQCEDNPCTVEGRVTCHRRCTACGVVTLLIDR